MLLLLRLALLPLVPILQTFITSIAKMTDIKPAFAPELSNTVYIFVTFFLMLWFLKASWRFWRSLRIRHAYLTDRLASINGLGSYLSYFEGATRAHIHAIAHTRQAMPPEKMKLLYVPYIMYKNQMIFSPHKDNIYLKIQLNCPGDSTIMLMTTFNSNNFKKRLTSLYNKSMSRSSNVRHSTSHNSHSMSSIRADVEIVRLLREQMFEIPTRVSSMPIPPQGSNISILNCPSLAQSNCCDKEIQFMEVSGGIRTVSIPLCIGEKRMRFTPSNGPEQLRMWLKDLDLAVLVLPCDTKGAESLFIKTAPLAPKDPAADSPQPTSSSQPRLSSGQRSGESESQPNNGAAGSSSLAGRFYQQRSDASSSASPYAHVANSSPRNTTVERIPEMAQDADLEEAAQLNEHIPASRSHHKAQITLFSISQRETSLHSMPPSLSPAMKPNPSILTIEDYMLASSILFRYHIHADLYEQLYPEIRPIEDPEAPKPAPRAAPQSASRAFDVSPTETLVLDAQCRFFSSSEIFGLGNVKDTTTNGESAQNSTAKQDTTFSVGGEFLKEECVVCLSEQKVVVLLPCRHLCVCASCLIYVDKCPVCRAFFQEYIIIQCPKEGNEGEGGEGSGGNNNNNSDNNNGNGEEGFSAINNV